VIGETFSLKVSEQIMFRGGLLFLSVFLVSLLGGLGFAKEPELLRKFISSLLLIERESG
jgi:hypothetical protein